MHVRTPIKWIASSMILVSAQGWSLAQSSQPATRAPSNGVRCPGGFRSIWDEATKVLRCRNDVVSWVVTACPDKAFASYLVKPGADACGPTEIPGVGTPPGIKGSKAVGCAAPGYDLMTDRTGDRDRCERTDRIFALPLPLS